MELLDLSPKEVNFSVVGLDLTFRPFTVGDDSKAQKICSDSGGLGKVFANLVSKDLHKILQAFEKISLIAWYQLATESQRLIISIKEMIFMDPETGEEKSAILTPIEKFRNLFASQDDQNNLFSSFLRCRGINIPDLKDVEALKKWNDQLRELLPSIGQ